MTPRYRRGVTLAELMVVIVILGVMAAVTAVAFSTRAPVPHADPRIAQVAAARAESIASGRAVTITLGAGDSTRLATVFPDGRVVADAPTIVDPLSGRARDASR